MFFQVLQPSLGLFQAVTKFRKAVKIAVTEGKGDQVLNYDVNVRDITTSLGIPVDTKHATELLVGSKLSCSREPYRILLFLHELILHLLNVGASGTSEGKAYQQKFKELTSFDRNNAIVQVIPHGSAFDRYGEFSWVI